jgi:hypothetical protein
MPERKPLNEVADAAKNLSEVIEKKAARDLAAVQLERLQIQIEMLERDIETSKALARSSGRGGEVSKDDPRRQELAAMQAKVGAILDKYPELAKT